MWKLLKTVWGKYRLFLTLPFRKFDHIVPRTEVYFPQSNQNLSPVKVLEELGTYSLKFDKHVKEN